MASSCLNYSAAAADALPMFRRERREQFRLLAGRVARKPEGASSTDKQPITITESDSSSVQLTPSALPKKQRIPGLNRGTIKLSEDFDDPLPDEFWLGIE